MRAFAGNDFLRAVGWNTVLFGFLSGLIILTYNAVIDARTATGSEAASLMGIQRAGVTLLQAVVLTKVMSQTSLGGPHRKAVVMQVLLFTVGIVAFAISMVGVADFTRQIEVALMSPAAMAAFAFLPSRYRGRVMVLNNVGAAAVGIMAATVFVHLVGDYVDPLWFIYPIGILMIARLGFNFVLDRRYVALLSESLLADNRLNLARLEENTGSILQDEKLLHRLLEETQARNPSIRVFIAGRLARGAQTVDDVERIRPFFDLAGQSNEALEAMLLEMLARIDHDRYADEIERGTRSPFSTVRIVARQAMTTRSIEADPDSTFERERAGLLHEFRRNGRSGTDQEFLDTGNLILRLENTTRQPFLDGDWEDLPAERQDLFLRVVADNPNPRYFSLLVSRLQREDQRRTALKGLLGMPEPFLLDNRDRLASLGREERLLLLKEMLRSHPVFTREESCDLLVSLLATVPEDFEELFGMLDRDGYAITDTALLVLSDPAPVPQSVHLTVQGATGAFSGLFPHLFSLRLNTPGLDRSRYAPLFTQLLDETLQALSVLVLTLSCIALPKEDDRLLARSICRDMRDRTVPVKQNALEFLETRMTGDTGKYLLLHYENLTPGEKRIRLKPLTRNRRINRDRIRSALHNQYLRRKDAISAEIINTV